MPAFQKYMYLARDLGGVVVTGEVEARNAQEAESRLRLQGLTLEHITPVDVRAVPKGMRLMQTLLRPVKAPLRFRQGYAGKPISNHAMRGSHAQQQALFFAGSGICAFLLVLLILAYPSDVEQPEMRFLFMAGMALCAASWIGMVFWRRCALRKPIMAQPPVKWLPYKMVAANGEGVLLKRTARNWVGVVVLGVISLIWNLVILAMFFPLFSSGAWVGQFAVLPFTGIGLLLGFLTVYMLLQQFAPGPEIMIRPAAPRIGDTLDIAWRCQGFANRLENLDMYLVAMEEAKYQQGTDMIIREEEFFRIPIISTDVREKFLAGAMRIVLPIGGMHTFTAPHNRIYWKICTRGTVRLWPNLSRDYDLMVLPLALGKKEVPHA